MKKAKLNLDKKSIARLTEESLENVQGGKKSKILCCTDLKDEEEDEMVDDSEDGIIDIHISCKK